MVGGRHADRRVDHGMVVRRPAARARRGVPGCRRARRRHHRRRSRQPARHDPLARHRHAGDASPDQARAVLRAGGVGVHDPPVVRTRWSGWRTTSRRHDIYGRRLAYVYLRGAALRRRVARASATPVCSSSSRTTRTRARCSTRSSVRSERAPVSGATAEPMRARVPRSSMRPQWAWASGSGLCHSRPKVVVPAVALVAGVAITVGVLQGDDENRVVAGVRRVSPTTTSSTTSTTTDVHHHHDDHDDGTSAARDDPSRRHRHPLCRRSQ